MHVCDNLQLVAWWITYLWGRDYSPVSSPLRWTVQASGSVTVHLSFQTDPHDKIHSMGFYSFLLSIRWTHTKPTWVWEQNLWTRSLSFSLCCWWLKLSFHRDFVAEDQLLSSKTRAHIYISRSYKRKECSTAHIRNGIIQNQTPPPCAFQKLPY